MVHGTLQFFFRNKTFLFVKIESWNFQHLFDFRFCETMQNVSLIRQTFRQHSLMGIKIAQIRWNLVRFHAFINQRDAKISDFYLDKQKSFIPKKILSLPCAMDSTFFSQQMAPWYVLTFLINGFEISQPKIGKISKLVSQELIHFRVIARLYQQIGVHSSRFALFCSFWRFFTIQIKNTAD